jgi:hypothetical protein
VRSGFGETMAGRAPPQALAHHPRNLGTKSIRRAAFAHKLVTLREVALSRANCIIASDAAF